VSIFTLFGWSVVVGWITGALAFVSVAALPAHSSQSTFAAHTLGIMLVEYISKPTTHFEFASISVESNVARAALFL
jgi:hypothetical protein